MLDQAESRAARSNLAPIPMECDAPHLKVVGELPRELNGTLYRNGPNPQFEALMFVLGAGTIAVAATGDLKLWAFYVSVVLIGAKVIAFAVQYAAFRILVTNRIRDARA